MDHISIIIVNYNQSEDTRECLQSLLQIRHPDFKYSVIVVDNGSKKNLTLSKSLLKDNVDLVRSESNLGFTGGNNLGITYAIEKYNSEYVLLLNNDTTVHADFLKHLYRKLRKTQPGGLVCPKIYFTKNREFHKSSYPRTKRGKIIWYAGGSIDWPNLLSFHRGVDEYDRGQFDNQQSSDFATGCCILISREILESVGLLDDNYFLYLEDADLSVRARNAGFEILFCPESVIWHKNAGSTDGSGSRLHQYYQTRNRIWFALIHSPWRYKITALRFALSQLFGDNEVRRKAAAHALIGNMGKETVI